MKFFALSSAVMLFLCFSSSACAQNTGRIECARSDGYIYLYSSVTTLEIRATLQCGELVQLTGRYDNYFGVRTAKGDLGFLPVASIVIVKDPPGTNLAAPAVAPPARERMHYDEVPAAPAVPMVAAAADFTLLNNTPVHVKLVKSISSATVNAGDAVEFEVFNDVDVDGVAVLRKGARASGVILQAEPKKHFGRGGRLVFNITSVVLADGQHAALRCYQDTSGSSNTSSDAVIPLASGKDVIIPQDTEFTALVDGDIPLKREAFIAPKVSATPASAASSQTPQSQH